MNKRSLIFIDSSDEIGSLSLISAVSVIFSDSETYGMVIGPTEIKHENYFDYIFNINTGIDANDDVLPVVEAITKLHNEYQFDCILIPATIFGRSLAPRLAMRLGVGLVADVTEISNNCGSLELIRPAYHGYIMARISVDNCSPIMCTIRPNVFPNPLAKPNSAEIIEKEFETYRSNFIKLSSEISTSSYDIRLSKLLLSAGGGIKSSFDLVKQLSDLLHSKISASRSLVDADIAPRSIQVGQSGKIVRPQIYIALGISGAIQHIEGVKNSNFIISVNKDRLAPICSISDLVIVGDASEFVNKLITTITQKKEGG